MDTQLIEALADIFADALLADLEAEVEAEQALAGATAESPRGTGSQIEHPVVAAASVPSCA